MCHDDVISWLDTNKDGKISANEIKSASVRNLAGIDMEDFGNEGELIAEAMATENGEQKMQVTCPAGSNAGDSLQIQGPNGERMKIQVPAGVSPGEVFMVAMAGRPIKIDNPLTGFDEVLTIVTLIVCQKGSDTNPRTTSSRIPPHNRFNLAPHPPQCSAGHACCSHHRNHTPHNAKQICCPISTDRTAPTRDCNRTVSPQLQGPRPQIHRAPRCRSPPAAGQTPQQSGPQSDE